MQVTINGRALHRPRKKVGLALSGGSLRGAAHIGVLKVLQREDIPIDIIAGTSAGAVVSAMHGCGMTPDTMEKAVSSLDIDQLVDININLRKFAKQGINWLLRGKFNLWSVLPLGLMRGEKIEQLLQQCFGEIRIRDTVLPVAIPATDIHNGETVLFLSSSGELQRKDILVNTAVDTTALLWEAVRASISIPGIFMPKQVNNRWLVDGGLKDNLPAHIAYSMGADIVLAVNLAYSGQAYERMAHIGDVLVQSLDIIHREVAIHKSERFSSFILNPNIFDVSIREVHRIPECIQRGEYAASRHIETIKRLVFS